MLKPGDRVVAGISGGADSVCLLFVLLEYAKRVPLSLTAVHVNHGIRPEAGEDARYVEALCEREGVPFCLVEEDVPARAGEWGCSEEEAGRRIRYQAFSRTAETLCARRIAVAHNRNDSAETMLFHLFRGTGIRGLGGIRPVRENVIRPLLCLSRREIERYLVLRDSPFCRDETNGEDAYTRNRIRHHILAYAEKEIAADCTARMAQTGQLLQETEDYLGERTEEAVASCVTGAPPSFRIEAAAFEKLHIALKRRVLYALAAALSPGGRDIGQVHVSALLTLFGESGNRQICLPFGIRGRREYGSVILERIFAETNAGEAGEVDAGEVDAGKADAGEPAPACGPGADGGAAAVLDPEEPKLLEGETLCRKGAFGELRFRILSDSDKKNQNIPQNDCTKWFDCDKIKKSLEIRTRRPGDYLTLSDGRGGQIHQSLKDYMITAKIPRQERDRICLLAEGGHILWLFGYRISEYYKISGNTKRILQVQLLGSAVTEDKNGRACESTVVGGRGRQADPGDR